MSINCVKKMVFSFFLISLYGVMDGMYSTPPLDLKVNNQLIEAIRHTYFDKDEQAEVVVCNNDRVYLCKFNSPLPNDGTQTRDSLGWCVAIENHDKNVGIQWTDALGWVEGNRFRSFIQHKGELQDNNDQEITGVA